MSGLLGGGKNTNTSAPVLAGLRVQTSVYGIPIPIVWGNARISANLLWYGDFTAIPHTSTQAAGGKGGGGSYSSTTYSYQAAGFMGLCEGPISGIGQAWVAKDRVSATGAVSKGGLGLAINLGNYPQAIWGYLTTNHPSEAIGYSGVAAAYSATYQLTDTAQMQNCTFEVQGRLPYGSTGQVGKAFTVTTGTTSWDTTENNAGQVVNCTAHGLINNQCVRLTTTGNLPAPLTLNTDYYVIYKDPNSLYLALAPNGGALPWPPNETTFALSGNAWSLKAYSTSYPGSGTHTITPYVQGSNPKDIITDFLTNAIYGVRSTFPVDAMSSYSDYCVASGLFLSPALIGQAAAHQLITDITDMTNAAPVWSEGVLKVIPYGDTSITGNGTTYTPNTTPQYDLNDDDFLSDRSTDPIIITRSSPADAFNQVQVSYLDRTNQYNPAVEEAKDQSNIDLYGLRPMAQLKYDYITDSVAARTVAQLKLQRSLYVRNTYAFKLSWKYARLEPMDLVTLTDSALGLNKLVVRITEVEESSDEELTILAEDYPNNNASATLYASQATGGFNLNANADPGLANAPLLFDAPGILTASGYELWIAAAGWTQWGGAEVWVSTDNTSYKKVGTINGGARYGVTTSTFTAGSDPDVTHNCPVDLTNSLGVMSGGAVADADNHVTLALLNDPGQPEIIAYSTANLTAAYKYNLTGYIRRGVFNTSNVSHTSGTPFVLLDNAIFKYPYDPTWIGKTVYVKLLSFNNYGSALYTLDAVQPLSTVIGGSISLPSDVTGLTCSQNGNVVVFQWDHSPDSVGYIAGFEFRYDVLGATSWGAATPITRVTKGTQITTAKVPPGSWTLMAKEVDVSGNYSRNAAMFNITVSNFNVVIATRSEAPSWPGTTANMVRHWTGVIYPDSQVVANVTGNAAGPAANMTLFNTFCYNPFPNWSYTCPLINSGFASIDRVWSSVSGYVPPSGTGIVDPNVSLSADAGPFTPWTIGDMNGTTYQFMFANSTVAGATPVFSNFTEVVDAEVMTVSASSVAIAANGTAITFSPRFHNVPVVQATVVGATGLFATVTGVTATGCTIHVFNTSNVDVGGTVNWSAEGG